MGVCVWCVSLCVAQAVSLTNAKKKSHQPSLCLGTKIMQRSVMLFSSLTQLKFAEKKTQRMFFFFLHINQNSEYTMQSKRI